MEPVCIEAPAWLFSDTTKGFLIGVVTSAGIYLFIAVKVAWHRLAEDQGGYD